MRMEVVRRVVWVVRRRVRVFVNWVRAAARSCGRSDVARWMREVAVLGRSGMLGGAVGLPILHRRVAVVNSWDDRAVPMVVVLERKKDMSEERMGRSEGGMCPFSWAVTISMAGWRSGGRSVDRIESVVVRIWDEMWFVRAVVRV
jgi:hypothetical protein